MGRGVFAMETIDRILSLLEKPWVQALLGLLLGAIAPVWAWMTALAGPLVVVLALLGFAAAFWFVNGLADYQKRRKEEHELPDYDAWLVVRRINLKQVALLLADKNPLITGLGQRPYAYFRLLLQAVVDGDLPSPNKPEGSTEDRAFLGVDVKLDDVAKVPEIRNINPEPKILALIRHKHCT